MNDRQGSQQETQVNDPHLYPDGHHTRLSISFVAAICVGLAFWLAMARWWGWL